MKTIVKSMAVALAVSLALFGCRPDKVGPNDAENDKHIAGMENEHATLDTICKYADSVHFHSVPSTHAGINFPASDLVNKCASPNQPSAFLCTTQQQRWGSFVIYNGYEYILNQPPKHWLDIDFNLASLWQCSLTDWDFYTGTLIPIDANTGFPVLGTDWSLSLSPARNQWKLRIPVEELPLPCFEMACRLSVHRLKNNSILPGSVTTLWSQNPNWNNTNSEFESSSIFTIRYCPFACLDVCVTATNTVCKEVFTGITCSNTLNSTTLTADTAGIGLAATFLWSNGATTSSIVVSPTSTTTYTVDIKKGDCTRRTTTYNVKVTNVACSVPDPRVDFCPGYLDVRPGMSFNIRNYVRMRNLQSVDWNNVQFTYTAVGANLPTNTPDWNLAAFNAGQAITVLSTDCNTGRGNVARGEYKIFVYRNGESTYDDFMTIRVHPTRTSNVVTATCGNSTLCGYIPGIKVCDVPPGSPGGGTNVCVPYTNLNSYINGVCGSTGANSGNYLGVCGASPCGPN